MRVCTRCKFPALIVGDPRTLVAPIPCGFCGGYLGPFIASDSKEGIAANRDWFKKGGRQRAERTRSTTK